MLQCASGDSVLGMPAMHQVMTLVNCIVHVLQVDRHIKEVHLELPDSAKEQKLLAAALHKSTGLHPTTLCLSHSGSRPGSKNAGEFIASPKLLHLLQNVQQLFFTTQPLGKGLATVSACSTHSNFSYT
jgi:hypothetical protein